MEAIWSSSASSTAIAAAGVGVPDDDIASGVGFGTLGWGQLRSRRGELLACWLLLLQVGNDGVRSVGLIVVFLERDMVGFIVVGPFFIVVGFCWKRI
jgi:hypothetical protein